MVSKAGSLPLEREKGRQVRSEAHVPFRQLGKLLRYGGLRNQQELSPALENTDLATGDSHRRTKEKNPLAIDRCILFHGKGPREP